jgi:hypothetical protein
VTGIGCLPKWSFILHGKSTRIRRQASFCSLRVEMPLTSFSQSAKCSIFQAGSSLSGLLMKSSWLWILLLLLFGVVPSVVIFTNKSTDDLIAKTQTATTTATIVSYTPEVHNRAAYQFNVASKAYQGGVSADQVYLGELVAIRYNPNNPEQNNLVSRKPMSLFGNLFSTGCIDTMILWIFFLVQRAKRMRQAKLAR